MTSRHDGTRAWNLTWTLENRLKQATSGSDSVSFVYDGDGNMVLRSQNGQHTVYLGKLYQHNHSSGVQTYQYFFNGQLVARREGSAVRFFLTDHLGGTATTLTPSGAVEAQLRYDPWGNARWASGTTPTSYRYTGQREDTLLGLYDYRARYYDPAIGRFISADTIVPDATRPQAFNRYAYVLNRPLVFNDPTGHGCNNPNLPADDQQACLATPVAPLPSSYVRLRFTFRLAGGRITTTVAAGVAIDSNAVLTTGHVFRQYSISALESITILDASGNTLLTSTEFLYAGPEEFGVGISLFVFGQDFMAPVRTASLRTAIESVLLGRDVQQAVFRGAQPGLYSVTIVDIRDQIRESGVVYSPIEVYDDRTIHGDSGSPLFLNGRVIGINAGSFTSLVGMYAPVTDIAHIRSLITDMSEQLEQ